MNQFKVGRWAVKVTGKIPYRTFVISNGDRLYTFKDIWVLGGRTEGEIAERIILKHLERG